jgi:lysophospholipase L1-like esterase
MRPVDGGFSRMETALKALGRSSALVAIAQRVREQIDRSGAGVDIKRGEGQVSAPEAKPDDFDKLSARYEELFGELATRLKERSIRFGVIFIPKSEVFSGSRSLAEPVIARAAKANNVLYLDASPILGAVPDPESRMYLWHWDERTRTYQGNGHLSREGNAVIGDAVAKWLVENKLVPDGK